MHIYIQIHKHVHIHVYKTHTNTHTQTHAKTYKHKHMQTQTHAHTFTRPPIYTHLRTRQNKIIYFYRVCIQPVKNPKVPMPSAKRKKNVCILCSKYVIKMPSPP